MADRDPYGAFNFLVEIEGDSVAGFTEVSGLEYEVEPIEYRTGNAADASVRKIPGLRKYGNITLKRGVTGDAAFWDWILQPLHGPIEKKTGRITLLDENREPAASWEFRSGWPCRYVGPHLVAGKSEVAIETIEICHEGLRLVGQ